MGNTLILGVLIMLFATIDVGTPAWRIALQAFILGFFISTQYTSMNTLVYADVNARQTSAASTIASTGQQMSISFGVASASLIAALFVPVSLRSEPAALIHRIHQAFIILGLMTMASSIVYMTLKKNDGGTISGRRLVWSAARRWQVSIFDWTTIVKAKPRLPIKGRLGQMMLPHASPSG